MNQLQEETLVKNEYIDSTSTCKLEIPAEIQMVSIEQESTCYVQSKMCIKTETLDDQSEFPVTAGTSYEICSEMDEQMVTIKCEKQINEIMEDPLDVSREIRVKEHVSIDLDRDEPRIKIEPSEEEDIFFGNHFLDTNSFSSRLNNQDRNEEHFLSEDLKKEVSENEEHGDNNLENNKDIKPTCHVCHKIFTRNHDLTRHLRIHTREKPFICHICSKSFTQKANLERHMFIHSDVKLYACDVCKKLFRDISACNRHKSIHSDVKSYTCSECNKSFRRQQTLADHKRTHTGDKPFICDVCNKAFSQRRHVVLHKRIHTGEKPYTCDICNRSFTQKITMQTHIKTHNK